MYRVIENASAERHLRQQREIWAQRANLAVEQAKPEDDLVVAYDTPHVLFRVPPLTLQPIVESAVKHGADPDTAPLHVLVRTSETDAGSEVVVEDDGPGFGPAVAEHPDTTLSNVRQRLDMMCGASLRIRPATREGPWSRWRCRGGGSVAPVGPAGRRGDGCFLAGSGARGWNEACPLWRP